MHVLTCGGYLIEAADGILKIRCLYKVKIKAVIHRGLDTLSSQLRHSQDRCSIENGTTLSAVAPLSSAFEMLATQPWAPHRAENLASRR